MPKQHRAFITIDFDDTDEFCRALGRTAKEVVGLANEAGQFTETEIIEKGDAKCTVLVNKDYSFDSKELL